MSRTEFDMTTPADTAAAATALAPATGAAQGATFLLLHTHPGLSLATDQLLLPPEQAPALRNAMALADALARLHATEQQRVQEAIAAGHARGLAEGHARGRAEAHQAAATELARTTHRLAGQVAAEARSLEQQLVPLALLVVRRIAAGLAPPTVLAALARQALEHLASSRAGGTAHDATAPAWQGCQLRLPAALLPAVRAELAALTSEGSDGSDGSDGSEGSGCHDADEARLNTGVDCAPGNAGTARSVTWPGLRLVADDSLAALDCVLESPGGRLLAGLETQLARVQARLSQPAPSASGVRLSA